MIFSQPKYHFLSFLWFCTHRDQLFSFILPLLKKDEKKKELRNIYGQGFNENHRCFIVRKCWKVFLYQAMMMIFFFVVALTCYLNHRTEIAKSLLIKNYNKSLRKYHANEIMSSTKFAKKITLC